MSNKELKELMSIICEGQDSEQRRKVENFIEYQVQLIDSLDKEIERLNNIINNLENELARVYEIELDYPIQFVKEEVEKVKLGVDKE